MYVKCSLYDFKAIRWILIIFPGLLHSNCTGLFRHSVWTWSKSISLWFQPDSDVNLLGKWRRHSIVQHVCFGSKQTIIPLTLCSVFGTNNRIMTFHFPSECAFRWMRCQNIHNPNPAKGICTCLREIYHHTQTWWLSNNFHLWFW